MRISVDTATDSHEHIRKVIDLLRHIVDGTASVVEQPSNPFGDMFGSSTPEPTPSPPDPTPTDPTPEPTEPSPDPTGTVPGVPQTINPSSTLDQSQPPTVDVWGNQKEQKDPPDDIETY